MNELQAEHFRLVNASSMNMEQDIKLKQKLEENNECEVYEDESTEN